MSGVQLKSLPLVERISERVIRVLGCNPGPMTLQGTNTYLIGRGRERMLVDTGDAGNAEYLQNLRRVVVEQEKSFLRHIIITHWHHDHIGGVDGVISALSEAQAVDKNTQVWKYPLTPANTPQKSCEDLQLPESSAAAQVSLQQQNETAQIGHQQTLHAVAEAGFTPVPMTRGLMPLCDNMELSVDDGSSTLKVVFTPGHTRDHIALLLKEENTLFSGDCVLGSGSTAVFENLNMYMKSLAKLSNVKPSRIYPGHGDVIDDAAAKLQFYIEHRRKREQQILQYFSDNKSSKFVSLLDITTSVYADLANSVLLPAAAVNVQHHLQKLCEDEVVVTQAGADGATLYGLKK